MSDINNRSVKLLDAIGLIGDEIIAEATEENFDIIRRAKKHAWRVLSSFIAACLVLAAAMTFIIANQKHINIEPERSAYSQNPDDFDFSGLPMLTIGEDNSAMGFEGHMAYDISELLNNNNPWLSMTEEDNIIALPVFKNHIIRDRAGEIVDGLSAEEMIQNARDLAEIMGWTIDEIYTNPTEEQLQKARDKIDSFNSWIEENENIPEDMKDEHYQEYYPETGPYQAVAKCGDYNIETFSDGHYAIDFGYMTGGLELPEKYTFTTYDNTDEKITEVMQYLLEQYKNFINMKSPAISLFGSYNIYAQKLSSYIAYESDGDLIDQILGYNFDTVWFAPREENPGSLWLMSRNIIDLSEKIGDYPIITTDEARELLVQNNYITTVPFDVVRYSGDFIDGNYISGVELVYRTGPWEEVFMPYYKFYIELTGFQRIDELNLKNYGVFYVPAVKSEYLVNMPIWDGRFN